MPSHTEPAAFSTTRTHSDWGRIKSKGQMKSIAAVMSMRPSVFLEQSAVHSSLIQCSGVCVGDRQKSMGVCFP